MARELMVEEYKSLRRELLQLAASISRWQLVGFAAAGAAIALALISGAWIAAAAALVVIPGCIFGIIYALTSILRIAAYIQVFHEGQDTGALWETRLESVRGADLAVPLRPYMTPIVSLLSVGLLCALVAGVMPVVAPAFRERQFWPLAIPAVWLIFWGLVQPSCLSLGPGGFRDKIREAFYAGLRRPGEKSGPK